MKLQSLLLIVDVVIAFALCYFIIRFVGTAFYGRAKSPAGADRRDGMTAKNLIRNMTKALFGVTGEEFFISEDKDAFWLLTGTARIAGCPEAQTYCAY